MNARAPWQRLYRLPEDPVASKHARFVPNLVYWLCTVLYGWVGTQFVAGELHDDVRLGWPLLKGVYLPWEWLWWASFLLVRRYHSAAYALHIEIVFALTIGMTCGGFALSLWLYKWLYEHALLHAERPPDVHGSAHFATSDEVHACGLLSRSTSSAKDTP